MKWPLMDIAEDSGDGTKEDNEDGAPDVAPSMDQLPQRYKALPPPDVTQGSPVHPSGARPPVVPPNEAPGALGPSPQITGAVPQRYLPTRLQHREGQDPGPPSFRRTVNINLGRGPGFLEPSSFLPLCCSSSSPPTSSHVPFAFAVLRFGYSLFVVRFLHSLLSASQLLEQPFFRYVRRMRSERHASFNVCPRVLDSANSQPQATSNTRDTPPTMPSLRSTVLAAAFVAATYADYIVDPKTVSLSMRSTFCADAPGG